MSQKTSRLVFLSSFVAMATGFSNSGCAQQVLSPMEAEIHAKSSMPEYLEFLTIPSDAAKPTDIARNAEWLERAFQKRGFSTRQLSNNGKPLVFAELGTAKGRKTILFYMHFDAQPVTPSEWQTEPWTPTLRMKDTANQWQTLPSASLQTLPLHPEWRIFARASADDKAPIVMFLAAMDALSAAGKAPEINIKVILDSEEEKGSPRLHIVMQENQVLLSSDGLVVYDGTMPTNNEPSINFGNRGSIQLDLTVFGPASAQHSGVYGNVIPNPALRLSQLLAGMKDTDGHVLIPGFYDGIALSDSERRQVAATSQTPTAIKGRLSIAQLEKLASTPLEAVQYPSLDILGLSAGQVGAKAANAIPASATASLNIRTVPEGAPQRMFGLVKQYVVTQGFHLIEGESPSTDERAGYDKLAKLSMIAYPSSASAARIPMDSLLAQWVVKGVKAPHGKEPEKVRMWGSTLPMSGAVDVLKMSYVVVPLVNADNNQHGANENMRLGNYMEGIRTIAAMLTTPLE